MKATEFCYWLQGMFELTNPQGLSPEQTTIIKQHLGLGFAHDIDPSASSDPAVQQKLNALHGGNTTYRC